MRRTLSSLSVKDDSPFRLFFGILQIIYACRREFKALENF